MNPSHQMLRCFAEGRNGFWQACCIDINLAAQGESFQEVRDKLDQMICEYLHDAIEGEDREHAQYLLNRKAPLSIRLRYYYLLMRVHVQRSARLIQSANLYKVPSSAPPSCSHGV